MIGSQWWLPSDIVWKLGTQFRLWRLRLWSNYDWLLLLQVRAKNCRWVPPSLPHMSCCPRLSVLFYKPAHGCPSARSWMAPVLLHVLLRCHSARSWIVPRRHLSARSWIVPAVTQENISWFRMYEFRTRCHGSSGLADYFLFFFRWLPRQGLPMASRWVPSMSCCLFCSMNGHTDVIAPVLLHVLLRCPSAGSWIAPLRHPSARSWIVPVETHEFCTLCSSPSLTIFSFLPVTSTTSLLQQARAEGSS